MAIDKSLYRPEIDGLRALAVLAVVLFHLGLELPGGFIGVDVFFVISGFLITGIIRRGLENETFSLAAFWDRRVRRIFPALFTMLVASLAIGYWLLLPTELELMGRSSVAQGLLLANVFFWRDTGYFAGPAELKPLLHTWSLAVEEQFYLFFPLALMFLKRLSSRKLFCLIAATALISFMANLYGVNFYPDATFYLLPTRAWELLVGCMLLVLPWNCQSSPRRDSVIAASGLLAIVLPAVFYTSETPFPGLAAIPPVLGTAAVIFSTGNTPGIWICRVLSVRPLVLIGLISYSLYLWHWPVIAYTRIYFGHFHWKQVLFASTVSSVLAFFSWYFVETPFRRNTYFQRRQHLFASVFACSGFAIAISFLFVVTDGLKSRFPGNVKQLLEDVSWNGSEFESATPTTRLLSESDFVSLGKKHDNPGKEIDFFVWGDSHGMVLSSCINDVATEHNLYGKAYLDKGYLPLPFVYLEKPNWSVSSTYQLKQRVQVMDFLENQRPRHLVLICRWTRYLGYTNTAFGERPIRIFDGRPHYSRDEEPREILKRILHDVIRFCSERNMSLWIVKQIPETGERAPARELLRYSLGRSLSLSNRRQTFEEHKNQQAPVDEIFDTLRSGPVRFVDLAPPLFDSQQMTVNYYYGRSLYRDHNHLTRWGTDQLKPILRETFRQMQLQVSQEE